MSGPQSKDLWKNLISAHYAALQRQVPKQPWLGIAVLPLTPMGAGLVSPQRSADSLGTSADLLL